MADLERRYLSAKKTALLGDKLVREALIKTYGPDHQLHSVLLSKREPDTGCPWCVSLPGDKWECPKLHRCYVCQIILFEKDDRYVCYECGKHCVELINNESFKNCETLLLTIPLVNLPALAHMIANHPHHEELIWHYFTQIIQTLKLNLLGHLEPKNFFKLIYSIYVHTYVDQEEGDTFAFFIRRFYKSLRDGVLTQWTEQAIVSTCIENQNPDLARLASKFVFEKIPNPISFKCFGMGWARTWIEFVYMARIAFANPLVGSQLDALEKSDNDIDQFPFTVLHKRYVAVYNNEEDVIDAVGGIEKLVQRLDKIISIFHTAKQPNSLSPSSASS